VKALRKVVQTSRGGKAPLSEKAGPRWQRKETATLGTRTILITSTIDAAAWDSVDEELTPEEFTALLFEASGAIKTPTGGSITCTSDFPDEVAVSSGKAKIGIVDPNNKLLNVSCVEITYTA